jgi:hypothetical protein
MASDIWQELAGGGMTIVAACLAAWLGVKVFLRQKEYDLVKQRYLDGGIDVVAAHQEEVIGIFEHNWFRCLQLVKMFRDNKESFDLCQLQQGFLHLDHSKFHAISHYRIQTLLQTQVFWEVYQLALAYAANANTKVTTEIPETIRMKLDSKELNADIKDIASQCFNDLKEMNEKSHKFAILSRELEEIAGTLQTENLTFKNVLAFHEKSAVKASIERLERAFADELKPHREIAA